MEGIEVGKAISKWNTKEFTKWNGITITIPLNTQ